MSRSHRGRLTAMAREIERTFLSFADRYSLPFLRYSLVIVFLWFGVLTAAGVGEVPELVAASFGVVPVEYFVSALGVWEIAIGVALLHRRTVRLGVVLVAIHAIVTTIPLATLPGETFAYFPYGPSFEGVFIIKNWVLLGGGMTVGGAID